MSFGDTWIYHERQEALLCGQHALNNLVQAQAFTPDSLAEIAYQLDQMELNFMSESNSNGTYSKDYLRRLGEASGNVDAHGNFSIEVLRSALMYKYNLPLPNIAQEGVGDLVDMTNMEGFICNRSEHWFAIRKINGRFWNLNSTMQRPEVITHFRLAAEIELLRDSGYSVFCVVEGLPPPCTSEVERQRGLAKYWWKETDLLQKKGDTAIWASNIWNNVGAGIRLDGRPTKRPVEESLTEEEMVQIAMEESLDAAKANTSGTKKYTVPEEPAQDTEGAARIQFRLPDGTVIQRRFLKSDVVGKVYAFVESKIASTGKRLELRYGYPPKDLDPFREKTIGEANLSGESISSRYV